MVKYQCVYCQRIFYNLKDAEKHEEVCFSRPRGIKVITNGLEFKTK